MGIITLTSDFGLGPFVGLMKGVILGISPQVRLVDLSHQVPAQDIRAGALVLEQAMGVFPPGTIHLGVVDPGVGTKRHPICVESKREFYVGPDNGLFTPMLLADPQARIRILENQALFRRPVSNTFHGRDIFAPIAAHLSLGLDPGQLGPVLESPMLLDWPTAHEKDNLLHGVVMAADSFGNLATNLIRGQVESFLAGKTALITLAKLEIEGISPTYGQAGAGRNLALFNSQNRLELALKGGDLCRKLGYEPGQAFGLEVTIQRR